MIPARNSYSYGTEAFDPVAAIDRLQMTLANKNIGTIFRSSHGYGRHRSFIDASDFWPGDRAGGAERRSRGNWNDIVCVPFYPVRSFRCPVTSVPVRFWCPVTSVPVRRGAVLERPDSGVIVRSGGARRAAPADAYARETETRDGALQLLGASHMNVCLMRAINTKDTC